MSRVKIEAERPYFTLFASANPSSIPSIGSTASTGPKLSS